MRESQPDNLNTPNKKLSRREFLSAGAKLGLAGGVLALEPQWSRLFGEHTDVVAAELESTLSYKDGLDELWRRTESTGKEHGAYFALFSDGGGIWLPAETLRQSVDELTIFPDWKKMNRSAKDLVRICEIHTHPSRTMQEKSEGRTLSNAPVAEPPSVVDVGMRSGTIRARVRAPSEISTQSDFFGLVKVSNGGWYFAQASEQEIAAYVPNHAQMDRGYITARNKVEITQQQLSPQVHEAVIRTSVPILLDAFASLLDPSQTSFPQDAQMLREATDLYKENKTSESDFISLLNSIKVSVESKLLSISVANRDSRLGAAGKLFDDTARGNYENYLAALQNMRVSATELSRKTTAAITALALASGEFNGNTERLLETTTGKNLYNQLLLAYAATGAVVRYTPQKQLDAEPACAGPFHRP